MLLCIGMVPQNIPSIQKILHKRPALPKHKITHSSSKLLSLQNT